MPITVNLKTHSPIISKSIKLLSGHGKEFKFKNVRFKSTKYEKFIR